MDERSAVIAGAALIVALLVVGYFIRWLRLRESKRRMGECLAGYFNGDLPLDRLAQLAPEIASRRFIGSPECQALVQATFIALRKRNSSATRTPWRSRSSSWPRSPT
jgi:hypothetical protein